MRKAMLKGFQGMVNKNKAPRESKVDGLFLSAIDYESTSEIHQSS